MFGLIKTLILNKWIIRIGLTLTLLGKALVEATYR